ncbi:hypothetical protein ACIPSE_40340 [Streptomyces sp. NPDC090106]|uniref:hypothetical protein n=1 Tax=Streptomyces sp. NPDC090106 TaxID=3365946 RepID=UPI0037FEB171
MTMLACPSDKCGSTNVQQLSHYWLSLASDSPLKKTYAPPAKVDSRAWIAALALIGGIALLVSGSWLLGLAVAAGGLLFGAWDHREMGVYLTSRADWESKRICLGCTGRF